MNRSRQIILLKSTDSMPTHTTTESVLERAVAGVARFSLALGAVDNYRLTFMMSAFFANHISPIPNCSNH